MEKQNIIMYTNKQTQYHTSVTMKTILLIIKIKIKKTADNKRTFVQFVFAYWQVVVVISGPELNRETEIESF